MGIQVIWEPEWPCTTCDEDYMPFVASWPDLFSEPQLRLTSTFPGWPELEVSGVYLAWPDFELCL